MTVAELIEHLQLVPEGQKQCEVFIAIRQYNKRYPVGYMPVNGMNTTEIHGQIRLGTSLPDGVYTASRDPNYFTV